MVCAGALLVIVAALLTPQFAGYFRSEPHAFAALSPFLSPLTLTATIWVVASSKGDSVTGQFVFWCGAGILGLFVLFAIGLAALHPAGVAAGLMLAQASLAVAVVDVIVLMAASLRLVVLGNTSA